MTESTRLFAVRVLLLHGLAFVALLTVTLAGVWSAYNGAQHQAIEDAGGRLQVVAQQTARGIESYYASIVENVRLVTREELSGLLPAPLPRGVLREQIIAPTTLPPRASTTQAQTPATTRFRLFEGRGPERLATTSFLSAIWRQIESRATHLIAVRTDTNDILRVEQRPGTHSPAELLTPAADWLRAPTGPAVSQRYVVDGFAYTLVGVRFAIDDPLKIVAVVPVDEVGKRFIDAVRDRRQTIGAALIDDQSTIVFATDRSMIGTNLERDATDPSVRRMVRLNRAGTAGFDRVDAIELQDGRRIERGLLASDAVQLGDGKLWTVSVNAPLADIGGVVNELFRGTLFWSPIVVVLFAAVMVSTAISLIRIRSRLERIRHQAIDDELTRARQIQLSWLPKTRFDGKGLHVAAVNEPASHVSGDFYNYFTLPDGRVALVIGDVTGHGMAAAFLMATTQLIVKLILNRTRDLTLTMNETNRALCEQVYSGQFVTLQLIVLDREANTLDIVNAGHPPPIQVCGGLATLVPTHAQIVLGVDEDSEYTVETFSLPPDASLLLYTDGVIECRSESGDRFSINALVEALHGAPCDPAELLARVTQIVNDFRGNEPLSDDTTAVAVQFQTPAERQAAESV